MTRYSYTQLGVGECGHIIQLCMGIKGIGERESETRYICEECSGSRYTKEEVWSGLAVWVIEQRGKPSQGPAVMRAKKKKRASNDPYRPRRADGLW